MPTTPHISLKELTSHTISEILCALNDKSCNQQKRLLAQADARKMHVKKVKSTIYHIQKVPSNTGQWI